MLVYQRVNVGASQNPVSIRSGKKFKPHDLKMGKLMVSGDFPNKTNPLYPLNIEFPKHMKGSPDILSLVTM